MRNIRGLLSDFGNSLEEDQGLIAVAGAVGGAALAFFVERHGPAPDPADFGITITQARSSLLNALALVFTGLSMVLALTALATGNMASKFSPRLLRMKLRSSANKWVLGVFAMTAAFIVTSQVLLRGRGGDDLAPPLTMSVSVALLVITGVLIVVYINRTLQSIRVDRAIRWIARRILRAVKAHEYLLRHDVIVDDVDVKRPAEATELVSPDDGYVVRVDTDRLHRFATELDPRVVIATGTGRPVVQGEPIGWVSASGSVRPDDLTDCLTIARTRDPESDVGYTISVLVDIALMALSPAVNDPRTGVECTEVLTNVFYQLSRSQLGIRTRQQSDGSPSVVVEEDTMGDLLDAAGRQILLYGNQDRTVTAALLRLGREGERFAGNDRDRHLARAFTADVDAARQAGAGSEGAAW